MNISCAIATQNEVKLVKSKTFKLPAPQLSPVNGQVVVPAHDTNNN